MQRLVRAEIDERTSANFKTVLWVYGAMGAAAGLFGVGTAIKSFIGRVDRIEKKLGMLDRLVREEEKRANDEQALMEAYALLGRIEQAERTISEHKAADKERWTEREAMQELLRRHMAHNAQ